MPRTRVDTRNNVGFQPRPSRAPLAMDQGAADTTTAAADKSEGALVTAAEASTTAKEPAAGPDDQTPEKPFEFLELPPELRNAIYALVVEDHPIVIPHNHRRRVKITSGLIRVNKMIHDEIRSYATLEAPVIRAQAIDFCFGHVITYLNRLGETQLKQLEHGSDMQRSTAQTIKIKLVFTTYCPKYHELDRWLDRFDVSAKRAATVRFEYEATEADGNNFELRTFRDNVNFTLDWRLKYSPERSRAEAVTIKSAFEAARKLRDTTQT
ncbi:hypothetical protein CKM354_000415700 [Cercospora kikuchii]|uniref:Uncharacterized protein n=1 Tax=Cercospora kikuchii TaxID=84275 RepID=A0A9P3CDB2_9PEZI|nr:uncharacterized protein CKM354_000415700 [Cercospora kikuchii]GIZ40834.1 hypothetical protein CKM354_000415700 [Cercospora kikuchii]